MPHVVVGQAVQFVIDKGREFVERGLIALAPGMKQRRYLLSRGQHPSTFRYQRQAVSLFSNIIYQK
jgi:hypothetical protein